MTKFTLRIDSENFGLESIYDISKKNENEIFEILANYKKIIYESALLSISKGIKVEDFTIWSNNAIGQEILLRCKSKSINTLVSVNQKGIKDYINKKINKLCKHNPFDHQKDTPCTCNNNNINHFNKIVLTIKNIDNLNGNQTEQNLMEIKNFCKKNQIENPKIQNKSPLNSKIYIYLNKLSENIEEKKYAEDLIKSLVNLQDFGIEPDGWIIDNLYSNTSLDIFIAQSRIDDRTQPEILINLNKDNLVINNSLKININGIIIDEKNFLDEIINYGSKKINKIETIQSISEKILQIYQITSKNHSVSLIKK